jgi:hypothetical protein
MSAWSVQINAAKISNDVYGDKNVAATIPRIMFPEHLE